MRPLLVGQAPGPSTDPDYPLYPTTNSGRALCQLMGVDGHEYLDTFDRVNLLYSFPGRHKRDDKFPVRDARIAAEAMAPLLQGRPVVFVGRGVAEAFGCPSSLLGFHDWQHNPRWQFDMAVVPHSSGRSRWYNNSANRAEATAFWADFVARLRSREPARKMLSSIQGGRI